MVSESNVIKSISDLNSPIDRSPRSEATKSEATKSEATKSETSRSSVPSNNSIKSESPRSEATKSESPRSEATRGESPMSEATRGETPRSEATKSESPRSEATKSEATRGETPRNEVTRNEVTRGEVTRGEVTRGEEAKSEPLKNDSISPKLEHMEHHSLPEKITHAPIQESTSHTGPTPHHVSDVDTWGGHPDRSYFTFVALSVVFGFLGLDHFYLRSFGTGTQKFFINITTLGSWYVWDLLQIFTDGKKIRSEGLHSPLDWMRGIGRGVFVEPSPFPPSLGGEQHPKESYTSKKSYLLYAFLAIFFGWLGADKFYLGEMWQGIAKVLSCFNIFLFLFGWLWVFWDSFHAFFLTDSLLKHGVSAPLPYNILFKETIPGDVFKVTMKSEELAKLQGKGLFGLPLSFSEFCELFKIPIPTFPVRELYREIIAPLMTPPIIRALQTPSVPLMPTPASSLPTLSSLTGSLPSPQEMKESVMNTAKDARAGIAAVAEPVFVATQGITNAMNKVHENATRKTMPVHENATRKTMTVHSGGAYIPDLPAVSSDGPGAVIAGALTAVVVAGGLKGFYDIISKQYG